ncbi:MAG: SPOR domain-containing protein, partial [Bacteroidia bacterium]|nr:SPOR domain-containing protein [Bacteroidia bacterium]
MNKLFRIDINKKTIDCVAFAGICILLCCLPSVHYGQVSGHDDDAKVRELVERHKSVNNDKQSIPGYRIQLYYGSDRQKAIMLKAEFLRNYPENNVYLIYQQPNFKVRTGDFKTKFEADRFFRTIKDDYPACFIV